MFLSDIVTPDSIIARSVNIERDLGDITTLKQYILTEKGLEIIGRFVAAMKGEKISAWSLTGPYGMGKSSFVNFFIALCGAGSEKQSRVARKILKASSESLHKSFLKSLSIKVARKPKGFFRVVATSSFEPINRTLAKALKSALQREFPELQLNKPAASLVSQLEKFIDTDTTDTALLTKYIQQAGQLYEAPVVVVLDEFGKNLEYMAQYTGFGDVYILQALAESPNIFSFVCLHQSFEEYASDFSSKQLQEWGKIQGRFEDISFIEPQQQMINFISHTLKKVNGAATFDEKIEKWAECYASQLGKLSLPGQVSLDLQTIKDCYPLHPIVVYTLPELCSRYAQNDRTLFAFLCGGDPHALPHFLHHNTIQSTSNALATFGLDTLYDYFLAVTNSTSINKPESKRWFEVNSIIEETRHFPAEQQVLIKSIGLLNLLAKPTGIRASKDITSFAVDYSVNRGKTSASGQQKIFDELINKGLLNYREYADEYRLWEGTDIDIASSLEEYKERASSFLLDEMLTKIAHLSPLIASRHSYKTGTLRFFERRWSSRALLKKNLTCNSPDADGLLIYCFDITAATKGFPTKTTDDRPVIVAFSPCEKQIKDAVVEAAATKNMLAESPELARDGIARKEARYRARIAENRLNHLLDSLYSPANEVSWHALGKRYSLNNYRDLSNLLSTVCDKVYNACPVVRNELINRNKLSSATARARRELIEAMVTRASEPVLGLQGTGPEVAVYRTMLLAEGVHRDKHNGSWKVAAPDDSSTYHAAWQAIDDTLKQAELEEIPLADVITTLERPPFGLKYGPIPILLCLYLIVKSEEVALYREKTFLPYLSPEEMELLVKRPDLFTVKRFAPTGIRNEVFSIYQKLLNTSSAIGEKNIRNATMVGVVAPLIQFANGLSEYVLQTKTISRKAQNTRRVLLNSKDPVHLLFEDLPSALNFDPFTDDSDLGGNNTADFQIALREALLELTKADQFLQLEISEVIQNVFFGQEMGLQLLQDDLVQRAEPLISRCADKQLKPFLVVLGKQMKSVEEWVFGLATVVSQRPVDSWRDTDLQIFSTRLHDYYDRFQALEAVVSAECDMPIKSNNQEVRYVSMMNSSGSNNKKILRVKKKSLGKMGSVISELSESFKKDDLEALLVLLGDAVLENE